MMPNETEVIGFYTNVMNELNVGMMADLKSNKMSTKQKNNWVTVEELKGCVNHWKMRVVADGLLERPFKSLFTSQINTIQKYLISLFLMGDIKENPAMQPMWVSRPFISISVHRPLDCAGRQCGAGGGHSHTEHYILLLELRANVLARGIPPAAFRGRP